VSRRNQIRMSEEEVDQFLRSHKTIILNSIGPRGYPHPMPMWFTVADDGAIWMTTFRKSQKVQNLRRDPRVSLLVESGEVYSELAGVVLYGDAEIIDDIDVVTRILGTASGAPSGDAAARPEVQEVMRKNAAKRVCLRVKPERVVSWDHKKLGGVY
jgi:PPOX class probable F420-dependent enzyme